MVHTGYPRNLGYLVTSMAGYHRNTFRIESTTAQTAAAGRVITINLPENAIIDLKSLRWVINDAVTNLPTDTGAAAVAALAGGVMVKPRLPFAQGLISRIDVAINGVQVTQGFIEYNTAYRLMRNAKTSSSKSMSIDNALQNANLGTDTTTTTFAGAAAGQDIQMIVQDWLGFFENPSTRFVDTGLLGMISLRITLADNNILTPQYLGITNPATAIAAAALPFAQALAPQMSYTLNNFYFTIDCITLNDGNYDMLVRDKLADNGFLTINFDEYYSFIQDNQQATTANVRFGVSSQSINKLYATLRPSTYTNRGQDAAAISPGNFGVESFQPAYFNFRSFADNTNSFKWNFSINNVYHPQYLASELEGLSQLIMAENKVGFESDGNLITSFNEYRNNKFCLGMRLNHPIDGETRNAYKSGFDSRGTNAQLVLQIQGINAPVAYAAYVLVNCTNSIKIADGRALELVT